MPVKIRNNQNKSEITAQIKKNQGITISDKVKDKNDKGENKTELVDYTKEGMNYKKEEQKSGFRIDEAGNLQDDDCQ